MPGFNSNYFNRNLLESMKDSLRSMMSENSKFQGTAMGTPNVGIGGPGDFSKVSDLQLQNRMRELKRHGLFGAKVKQSDEYLATEAEYKRRQEAKQPAATPKQPAAPVGIKPEDVAPQLAPKPAESITPPLSDPSLGYTPPTFAPVGPRREPPPPAQPKHWTGETPPMRPLPGHSNPILPKPRGRIEDGTFTLDR